MTAPVQKLGERGPFHEFPVKSVRLWYCSLPSCIMFLSFSQMHISLITFILATVWKVLFEIELEKSSSISNWHRSELGTQAFRRISEYFTLYGTVQTLLPSRLPNWLVKNDHVKRQKAFVKTKNWYLEVLCLDYTTCGWAPKHWRCSESTVTKTRPFLSN